MDGNSTDILFLAVAFVELRLGSSRYDKEVLAIEGVFQVMDLGTWDQ